MPRPYSTDLRGRTLLACERDGDSCAAVARRFRVGVSTLHLWRKQARDVGRRAPRPMGRGPAPLGGKLAALAELAAEHRDATLAEYADLLAERTGEPKRSTPVICRALKRLGWVRKQRRSGPTSGTGRTWRSPAPHGAARPPGSTRPAWSLEFLDYRTPPTGRRPPADARADDLAHAHLALRVDDLARLVPALEGAGARLASPGVVALPGGGCAAQVLDPDAHALVLEQAGGCEPPSDFVAAAPQGHGSRPRRWRSTPASHRQGGAWE